MNNTFYVYVHRRLDTGAIFNVGKGSGLRAWKVDGRNVYWKRIVKKVGYSVDIVVAGLTEDKAFGHEMGLIKHYRNLGLKLVNMTDGGEGKSGCVPSEETRKKLAVATKGENNPFYGKSHSEDTKAKIRKAKENIPESTKLKMRASKQNISLETREKMRISALNRNPEVNAKISATLKGRTLPEEVKLKISIAGLGRKMSEETKCKISTTKRLPENSRKQSELVSGANNPRADDNIYKFINKDGEVFKGTRLELSAKYSLNSELLSGLFHARKAKTACGGWRLAAPEEQSETEQL